MLRLEKLINTQRIKLNLMIATAFPILCSK